MKRTLNHKALIAAIVAVLVALCFLWPHSLVNLLPQESGYHVGVMRMLVTDGELDYANPAYEVAQGSAEDAALRDLLSGYHYYLTPLSLLQSAGLFQPYNTTDYFYFMGEEFGTIMLASDGSVKPTSSHLRYHIGLGGRGQSQEIINQALSLLDDWGAVDQATAQ
jgi:hypothetical protein